ncbi:MAG: hypothetical protein ONB48_20930 [candidate division KSB1 bacterium]|nr:hypothetical protein [candidate division KSB1 bacterium]MDZ7276444.1 hypothetical protein [candidate division KSB1 bacterium]MDZ7288113.1 hypothetical protein [candidate division KSB1 bacterium]MDZ7300214.1 hypothetical protein [candidate division KSB1 bacterium]MDZ7305785.1 hypothetical protein [candidate division KSB1 bacterium]
MCSCGRTPTSLYEGIPTDIVAIAAYSHADPAYHPVPDSLRLRFHRLLRLLRVTVVAEGCAPQPAARVASAGHDHLVIQFDMNNACIPPAPFDVDIHVSPIHPDTFHLTVEMRDFESDAPGQIVLNRQVSVQRLPGF